MSKSPLNFTVQVNCTGMGWVDSKYGSSTYIGACSAENALLADDSAWLPGERQTRIIESVESIVNNLVLEALIENGWHRCGLSEAAIAYKNFVGVKIAHIYFTKGDEYNRTLCGEYYSEGRDILQPHHILIPHGYSFDKYDSLIAKFVVDIEVVISNSYAARLLVAEKLEV
jgi:hypothetical protein